MLQHCLDTAHAALDNTVNQNPVLKKAGVVDAGGMGFCLILRGMLESLRGNDIVCEDTGAVNEEADFGIFDSEDISFAFDTVFIVRKREDITSLDPLREYLGSIGDSLVIGEDDEAFKVHVHTNIPGDALSEAQKYGTLELAKIENMRLQHDDLTAGRKARSTDDLEAVEKELENQPAKQEAPAEPEKRYGSVAVCAGAGLAGVFRDLGVDEIIEGGQTMNPSTEDILHAIEKTPAEIVFVLPNNKNIIMAAQAAAELASREVVVIPTKTVPQGISAMLAFDAAMEPSENEAVMTDCLSGVMTMQITYAARDSDFDGFDIHAGDYLGLCDGALAGTTREITTLLASLADKAAEAGKEFINIFYGADIQESDAEAALELFRQHAPRRGGQSRLRRPADLLLPHFRRITFPTHIRMNSPIRPEWGCFMYPSRPNPSRKPAKRFRRASGGPHLSVLPEKMGGEKGRWDAFGASCGYSSGRNLFFIVVTNTPSHLTGAKVRAACYDTPNLIAAAFE